VINRYCGFQLKPEPISGVLHPEARNQRADCIVGHSDRANVLVEAGFRSMVATRLKLAVEFPVCWSDPSDAGSLIGTRESRPHRCDSLRLRRASMPRSRSNGAVASVRLQKRVARTGRFKLSSRVNSAVGRRTGERNKSLVYGLMRGWTQGSRAEAKALDLASPHSKR
jgi:hypothetical protein